MNEAGWVALIVAAVTSAGGLYTAVTTRRRINADAESVSVATMRHGVSEGRAELERCHDDRATVMARLETAEARIASLEAYMKLNHGIDPEDIAGQPI